MKVNSYYLKARFFPAVLTSIPAIIFYNKFIGDIYSEELSNIYAELPTVSDVILSGAIVFLLVQINRFLSKEIFQRLYFKEEIFMPTTDLLLKSNDELEYSIKQRIEDKIKNMFNINLLTSDEESADEIRARKIIITTVSQIRNVLRNNSLLFQHNIEYGFVRNLIGGSLQAFIISIVIFFLSHFMGDANTRSLGLALTIIYLIPIIFSKMIIVRYGKYYAKILYEQFLSI